MKEIEAQMIVLIDSITKIHKASDNFIKNDNPENIRILAEIVKQSETEFDILKQKLAKMIEDKESIEVEVIETENGFKVE